MITLYQPAPTLYKNNSWHGGGVGREAGGRELSEQVWKGVGRDFKFDRISWLKRGNGTCTTSSIDKDQVGVRLNCRPDYGQCVITSVSLRRSKATRRPIWCKKNKTKKKRCFFFFFLPTQVVFCKITKTKKRDKKKKTRTFSQHCRGTESVTPSNLKPSLLSTPTLTSPPSHLPSHTHSVCMKVKDQCLIRGNLYGLTCPN